MTFEAKWSYVTRKIDEQDIVVLPGTTHPAAGDVAFARVTRLGGHRHMENADGRRCRIHEGDVLVGAFGNRYATDVFEGYVPTSPHTHLLTAGGLIGSVTSRHDAAGEPTELEVIGRAARPSGELLSLDDYMRPTPPSMPPALGTVVVVGASMNAGKTTTAASIVRGWAKHGIVAGAGKVTGSGSGKDRWTYVDAGANSVVDFLDFGMSSTFGYPITRIAATMTMIRDALVEDGAQAVVLEIADGLLQRETAALLGPILAIADAVVLAVSDGLSAQAGTDILERAGIKPAIVGGLVSCSPLASLEAERATGIPVYGIDDLVDGRAVELLARRRAA